MDWVLCFSDSCSSIRCFYVITYPSYALIHSCTHMHTYQKHMHNWKTCTHSSAHIYATHTHTHTGSQDKVLTCESLLSASISFSRSDPCHHGDRAADISPVLLDLSFSINPPVFLSFICVRPFHSHYIFLIFSSLPYLCFLQFFCFNFFPSHMWWRTCCTLIVFFFFSDDFVLFSLSYRYFYNRQTLL